MTANDQTLRLIDQLLTHNESIITTLYYDYNELDSAVRSKTLQEHYKTSKIIREITGVNAYHQRSKEESYRRTLEECEKSKEDAEALASTISETLTSIKNPEHYRNYKINKNATSPEDLFEVTLENEPSKPLVEPKYPNTTKEEWLCSIEHAREYFQDEYKKDKEAVLFFEQKKLDPETSKSFGLFPPVLKEVLVDEEVLALVNGFMIGPVGLFNNKTIIAENVLTYDSLECMSTFLKEKSYTKDIVVYLLYKQDNKYCFRGVFVDKSN